MLREIATAVNSHRNISAAAVIAAMTAAAGVAIASGPDPLGPPPDRNAARITGVAAADAEHFAILRQSPLALEDLPPRLAQRQGLFGINVSYAHRARQTPSGADAYVVPGDGVICLFGDEVGGSCSPTVAATKTPALTVGVCGAGLPRDKLIVAGVVADDQTNVVVHLRNGEKATGNVVGNVYSAYAPLSLATVPTSVTWTTADGAAGSLPLTVPDAVVSATCEG